MAIVEVRERADMAKRAEWFCGAENNARSRCAQGGPPRRRSSSHALSAISQLNGWLLRELSVETIRAAPACGSSRLALDIVGVLFHARYSRCNAAKRWLLQHANFSFSSRSSHFDSTRHLQHAEHCLRHVWRDCAGNNGPACRLRSTERAVATVLSPLTGRAVTKVTTPSMRQAELTHSDHDLPPVRLIMMLSLELGSLLDLDAGVRRLYRSNQIEPDLAEPLVSVLLHRCSGRRPSMLGRAIGRLR